VFPQLFLATAPRRNLSAMAGHTERTGEIENPVGAGGVGADAGGAVKTPAIYGIAARGELCIATTFAFIDGSRTRYLNSRDAMHRRGVSRRLPPSPSISIRRAAARNRQKETFYFLKHKERTCPNHAGHAVGFVLGRGPRVHDACCSDELGWGLQPGAASAWGR
jgi:hypothetical protein